MSGVKQVTPTHLQQLMLTGQSMNPESPLYNMAFRFDLLGVLDTKKFVSAFYSVVQANDCLRMRLSSDGNLEIDDTSEFELSILEGDPGIELKSRACTALALSKRCFDSVLYRVDDEHHIWYLNQHHIITDGAAFIQFFRQLENTYRGHESTPACSFDEVQQSEVKSVTSSEYSSAAEFWKSRNVTRQSELKSFQTETERNTIELSTDSMLLLSQAISQPGIRSISHDLSVFSVLAAVLLILRYRLFSTTDSTLGTPFHNRRHASYLGPELEIGFIQVDVNKHSSFIDIVQSVQSDVLASMKHCLPGISSAHINNSFSWLLNYVSQGIGDFADLRCKSEWLHPNAGDAAHAVRIQAHDFNQRGRLTLHFDLAENRLGPGQRKRLPEIFERLLRSCLVDCNAPFKAHSLIDADESDKIRKFNNTISTLPRQTTVFDLFYQQLNRTPKATALTEGSRCLSYQELNKCVNAVAIRISAFDVVPILIGRSIDAVVAMLAALKTGHPFIPLEIQHPDERINTILDELGNPPLLTSSGQSDRKIRCQESILIDQVRGIKDNSQAQRLSSRDIAHIIFTSGTTGVPKGVEIGQESFTNYLVWAAKKYADNKPIDMPLYSSLAFDLTLTSIFLPLLTGGRVVVYPQKTQTAQLEILDVFKDDKVDIVKLTPSHLRLALRALNSRQSSLTSIRKLKSLIVGGEDLPRSLAVETQEGLGSNRLRKLLTMRTSCYLRDRNKKSNPYVHNVEYPQQSPEWKWTATEYVISVGTSN